MRRDELGIEKLKTVVPKPVDERGQRGLGGIAHTAEHRLAEEGRTELDPVEAADKLVLTPGLHAVRGAGTMEHQVTPDDLIGNPGRLPVRTFPYDILECRIDPDI